jgi:hypothetical protein
MLPLPVVKNKKPSKIGGLLLLTWNASTSGYVIHDFPFTGVFGILPRLGEIGIGGFQHGVLVPVPQLAIHRGVPGLRTLVLLNGALFPILILGIVHE